MAPALKRFSASAPNDRVAPVNSSAPVMTTRARPTEKTRPPTTLAMPTGIGAGPVAEVVPCCETRKKIMPMPMKAPAVRASMKVRAMGAWTLVS